jgi:hypothetical protein
LNHDRTRTEVVGKVVRENWTTTVSRRCGGRLTILRNARHRRLEVLKLLTYEAGLRLRIEKCRFFRTEVPFLGHLLTREGIRMDPRKVKSITNWQCPVDGKAMQRFLGL